MKLWLRKSALVLTLLTLQTSLSSCFGRFALTRKLYGFNESIGDKWLRSIVTFFMVVIPVYGVCAFVDWALLNTIEFWSGSNPLGDDGELRSPKLTASNGSAVTLQLSPSGDEMRVELSRAGALPRVLILSLHEGGAAELRDGGGALLASLQTNADGLSVVRGMGGELLQQVLPSVQLSLEEALCSGGSALLAQLERFSPQPQRLAMAP